MNKHTPAEKTNITFGENSVYEIIVRGEVPTSYAGRLGGMQVRVDRSGHTPVSSLVGKVHDQSELMGILTALYQLHLPLISAVRL